MVPEVHTATLDVVSVLVAPATTDGTPDEQAVSGAASTPATCSTRCLPRHPVAEPLLAASSTPNPSECVLGTNKLLVAAVPVAMTVEFLAVVAPMDSAPPVQLQQPYSDNELFSSSQCVTNKVPIHRPIPWPSLLDVQHHGDDTGPLPWPSYMVNYNCETPSEVIMRLFQLCSSDSLRTEDCAAIQLQISDFYGNLFSSTGYIIIHDMSISSELTYLDELLLFLGYWWSFGNYGQSVRTTLNWPSCLIPEFPLWVIVGSFKLKPFSNGYATITLLSVPLDSGTFAALSVQISTDYFITSEYVLGELRAIDWRPLDFPCRAAVPVCYSGSQELGHYLCSSQLQELVDLNSVRSYDNLQETMKLMTVLVLWQYLSQAELTDTSNSITICLRFAFELEMISIVPCLSLSCYTAVHDMLSKMYGSWKYRIFNVGSCSSCLNDTVIYTSWICVARQTIIKPHKPRPPVQGISTELLTRDLYRKYCCFVILIWDLHSWAPTMLNFAWGNLDCIFSSRITRRALQVVSNSPLISIKLLQQSDDIHLQLWPLHIFSLGNELFFRAGIFVYQIFMVDYHWWNCAKDQMPGLSGCDLTNQAICEVWLPNYQDLIQWQIARKPCAHACLIMIELLCTHSERGCFLCPYHGRPALILFLEFDRHEVSQGGRCARISIVHYISTLLDKMHIDQDQVCADHDYQFKFFQVQHNNDYSHHDLGGTKKLLLSWNPGRMHVKGLDRDMMLRLPWDPGVADAAWGQATFQGGRGVRNPSYTHRRGLSLGPLALSTAQVIASLATTNIQRRNGDGIQTDRGGTTLPPSPLLL